MRAVRRTDVAVPTLKGDGAGAKLARQQEDDRVANPAVKLSFPDHWNNADVRGALYALHGRACAYCGCLLPRNDRGDVEHFRPKGKVDGDRAHGGYWWLAYVFNNYLLSCSVCNRTRKRDRFPLRPGGLRVVYDTRHDLAVEPRILLNPALDAVEEWLRVEWESDLCRIRPGDHLPAAARAQVEQTLKFFLINEDPDLLRERKEARDRVVEALTARDFKAAGMLAVRYRPHSLIARQILLDRHAAAHLPTPADELRWLLDDLMETLIQALKLLVDWPGDRRLRDRASELLWSFAVLWRNPPAGTSPGDVEQYLRGERVLDKVREYYDKL
jgi:hypothetical protein